MRHWIVPGDWIIRAVLDPTEECGDVDQLMVRSHLGENRLTFCDHAIYVLDATQTHLTIHDPVTGIPRILPLTLYPGEWLLATHDQVEVTWLLSQHTREKESMMIRMEMDKMVFCQGPKHRHCLYAHRKVAREAIMRARARSYREEDNKQREEKLGGLRDFEEPT